MGMDYKKAGVDILKAEKFIGFIKEAVGIDTDFGCVFPWDLSCDEPILVSSADGVGTKLKLAFLSGIHNTVGIDLVAMNVNDILCRGARPLFFLDYIATGRIEMSVLKSVISGIIDGCEEAKCKLIGGETAEMPDFYREGEYDLSGFCVGVVDRNNILPKVKQIKPGDLIVGVSSSGLHSNGFSLVRKVFDEAELIERAPVLLTPTRIYVPILSLLERYSIKQIAHITGGGFYLKAIKGLPADLGIKLNCNSWPIAEIFLEIQKRAGLSREEMFSTFNMGIGLTLVVERDEADEVCDFIRKWWPCWIIGEIVNKKGVILG